MHSCGQGFYGALGRGGLASASEELEFKEAKSVDWLVGRSVGEWLEGVVGAAIGLLCLKEGCL